MKIKVSNVNTPNWKEVTVKSRIPVELERLSGYRQWWKRKWLMKTLLLMLQKSCLSFPEVRLL